MKCLSQGMLRTMFCAMWLGVSVAAAPVHAQTWKPVKNVELVVPFAPGAGVDVSARSMQAIWTMKHLVETSSVVVNKAGGLGNVGLIYVTQHPGDAHYLVIGSTTLLTNQIVGVSTLSHTDFTPIAVMLSEHVVFSVRADSPLRSGADILQRLQKDPQSLSISIGSAPGNVGHIAMALVAKAAGIDPKRLKVVVFGSAGEGMTALVGGHVDVSVSTLGVMVPQIEAGKLRALAVASAKRLSGVMANVPTWKEQGISAETGYWRGIFAPRGITPEQVAYWEDVLANVNKSDDWQAMAGQYFWDASFKGSKEMRAYIASDYATCKTILTDLGMAKQ